MTKYARLDNANPPNVIGFYDTDMHDYKLPPPEELVELSDDEWARRISHGSWKWVNGALSSPPVSLATQALTALRAAVTRGAAFTSATNPSLNATYALDPASLTKAAEIARDAAVGLGLPGGKDSVDYADFAGELHKFSEAQFIAFYRALRDRVSYLNDQAEAIAKGLAPSWPDDTPVIID